MEVAVMSLSAREQEALNRIEDRLAGTDPELAGRLATFARLTSGEVMPAREQLQTGARKARGPTPACVRLAHAMAVLWVLVAMGMIAAAVSLSGGASSRASGGACVPVWPTACAGSAPARVTPARSQPPVP
jgi:hypothetical protein